MPDPALAESQSLLENVAVQVLFRDRGNPLVPVAKSAVEYRAFSGNLKCSAIFAERNSATVMHLHGLWSELETGDGDAIPRKHTILVQPGSTASYLVSADAIGRWAYHCHLQFHMMGMMREVRVV